MKKLERLSKIESMSQGGRYVTINEVVEKLGVSESTVRRDLAGLSRENMITVNGGGFIWNKHIGTYLQNIRKEEDKNFELKQQIAEHAATLFRDGDLVYIESGVTLRELVKRIPKNIRLTIVTPDLMVALELSNNLNVVTIILGGNLLPGGHTVAGDMAINNIQHMCFTKVFLSPHSITASGEIMFTNILMTTLRRYAIEHTQKIIVLANHTKFGSTGVFSDCNLCDVDMLITDYIPDDYKDKLSAITEISLIP